MEIDIVEIGTVFLVGILLFFGWIWIKNKSPGQA